MATRQALLDQAWRTWRADAILAVGFAAVGSAAAWSSGLLIGRSWLPPTLAVAGLCAAVVLRRFHPVAAGILAGGAVALPGLTHSSGLMNNAFDPLLLCVFLASYWLGAHERRLLPSLLGLAAVVVGTGVGLGLNPLTPIMTMGPWVGGLLVQSRRRMADELAERGRELEEEQALYAREAVRYERARIGRELHDIVAHCVSLIVVQAGAGQRLLGGDPAAARAAFESISAAAGQADREIDRLVELLADPAPPVPALGIRMVNELVARAAGLGLAVTCHFKGDPGALSSGPEDAAYRMVQESLTNALKHAPGAPVEIVVACPDHRIEITVVNGPGHGIGLGLDATGGGHGIAGMRERAEACGGRLCAGPTPEGGWSVEMSLPRSP